MCVLSDVVLNGLLLTSTSSSLPNPVFSTNGEISEMLLLSRNSNLSLAKPDSDEITEILLLSRSSRFRLVKPDSDGIFEILLCTGSKSMRIFAD